MTEKPGFRFLVEETFTLPSRSYVLAVGRLEHGVAGINDPVWVRTPDGRSYAGSVVQIEIHTPPGRRALGIGGPAAEHLVIGTVIESG